jgi:hypothetical protein
LFDNEDINYKDQYHKTEVSMCNFIELIRVKNYLVLKFKKNEVITIPIRIFENDDHLNNFITEINERNKLINKNTETMPK